MLALQKQSDLPTFNVLVSWQILFVIWTFRLRTLQELIDLLTCNGLTCKDLQMTGLLTLQEQSNLLTLNGLVWWLILFTMWKYWLRSLQKLIDLLAFKGAVTGTRYFARSKFFRSLAHKKYFSLIWQIVFKLRYICHREVG